MNGRVRQRRAVKLDGFVTGILGYPVYELVAVNQWPAWREAARDEPLLAYARVPAGDQQKTAWLLGQGWELVDTNVQLEKITCRLPAGQARPATGIAFRLAQEKDEEAVAKIARQSFTCSRWHRDARIGKDLADKIKEEWARNFWRNKRGDFMVVAEQAGRVVGFNQLLRRGGALVIDLIAVDYRHRQKGLALGMIAFAEANCGLVEKMIVGTQLTNMASLKMYQRSGFVIRGASHILHWHFSDGR